VLGEGRGPVLPRYAQIETTRIRTRSSIGRYATDIHCIALRCRARSSSLSCERHGSWEWHYRHSTSDTRTQSTDADTIGRHKGVRATSQSVTTLLLIHAMDDGRSGGRDFAQARRSGGRLSRISINCDESTYACRNSVEHEIETVTPSTRVEGCDTTRRRRGITLSTVRVS